MLSSPEAVTETLDLDKVIEEAYDMLADRTMAGGLVIPRDSVREQVGESGICDEASDAVTRAAYKLGLMAVREFHEDGPHYITAFSDIDQPPSDDDLIVCLTWGQFSPTAYAGRPGPFIGTRREMASLIDPIDYQDAFAPESVTFRQVTHTPSANPSAEHVWLKTSHDDLTARDYPVGEVPSQAFDAAEWQFPYLVAS